MARSLVTALTAHVEGLHGIGWQEAIAQHRTFSEFLIYGHYCRAFVGDDRVDFRESPPWAVHLVDSEQAQKFDEVLASAIGDPRKRFLLLQSILKQVDHAALLARMEQQLANS